MILDSQAASSGRNGAQFLRHRVEFVSPHFPVPFTALQGVSKVTSLEVEKAETLFQKHDITSQSMFNGAKNRS